MNSLFAHKMARRLYKELSEYTQNRYKNKSHILCEKFNFFKLINFLKFFEIYKSEFVKIVYFIFTLRT